MFYGRIINYIIYIIEVERAQEGIGVDNTP